MSEQHEERLQRITKAVEENMSMLKRINENVSKVVILSRENVQLRSDVEVLKRKILCFTNDIVNQD